MSISFKFLSSLIILLPSINSSTWSCLNFDPIAKTCISCQPGYYLTVGICLLVCPDGFISKPDFTCEIKADPSSIWAKFYNYKTLTIQTAGPFEGELSLLSDFSENFIPTQDRGFYAHKTSNLKSSIEHSLSPTFTFQLYFRPETSGMIFVYGTILIVYISGPDIIFRITIFDQINNGESTRTASIKCNSGIWNNLNFFFKQENGWVISGALLNSGSIDNSVSISTASNERLELSKRNPEYLYMGDPSHLDSASGFYYELKITNALVSILLDDYNLNTCDYLSYWDGSSCLQCMMGCQFSCVRGTDCITCASSNCDQCQGYGLNDCVQCNNAQTAPVCCDFGCSQCLSLLQCTLCSVGFYMTSIYCVFELPTGYEGSIDSVKNVIQVNFGISSFKTLLDEFDTLTASPVFVKGRGLYFDGNSYLVSKSKFVLAACFSVEILFKCDRAGVFPVFFLKDTLTLFTSNYILEIATVDTVGKKVVMIGTGTVINNIWNYLTVVITPNQLDSLITIYQDTTQVFQMTSTGILRMRQESIILGFNNIQSFSGFIHDFQVSIGAIDPNLIYFSFCTPSISTSCIEDCNFLYFFDSGSCSACLAECSSGCVRGTDCNPCFDSNCFTCSNFEPGTCSECFSGFLLDYGSCSCPTGMQATNKLCACGDSSKRVYVNRCVSFCPDPCSFNSTHCICTETKVWEIRFGSMFGNGLVQSFYFGSNNAGHDINDPLFQDLRGAYFSFDKFIQRNMVMANQFLLVFWIKVENDGVLFSKSGFLTKFKLGSMKVTLDVSDQSVLMDYSFAYSSWIHFVIKVSIEYSKITTLSLYYFGVLSAINSFPENYFIDDISGSFSIGQATVSGQVLQGFQGFLWSVSMFLDTSLVLSDFTACSCPTSLGVCPQENECLSLSGFHYSTNNPTLECDSKCSTCADQGTCLVCYSNFTLNSGLCVCENGYILNTTSNTCEVSCNYQECYLNCLSCLHCAFAGCTSCQPGFYLLFNACVLCPTGYLEQAQTCVFQNRSVIDLKFDGISQLDLLDHNGQPAEPGFYFRRGGYFSNQASFKLKPFVLSPDFSLQIWFLASSTEGCLFSKQDSTSASILKICLVASSLALNVKVSNGNFAEMSLFSVSLSTWNYFSLREQFMSPARFQVVFRLNQQNSLFEFEDFIIDEPETASLIGSCLSNAGSPETFFTGFIYMFKIFHFPSEQASSPCSEPCFACLTDGSCLSTCRLGSSLINQVCQTCDQSLTCLMCGDFLCDKCRNVFGCEKCKNHSTLVNGKCFCSDGFYLDQNSCLVCQDGCKKCDKNKCLECYQGFFLDETCSECNKTCVECNKTSCLTCVDGHYLDKGTCYKECDSLCRVCSLGQCLECEANAFLAMNECACNEGFRVEGKKCSELELVLNISVSKSNDIILLFSEDLEEFLTSSCLNLSSLNNSIKFKVDRKSPSYYFIYLNLKESVKKGQQLFLQFLCKIRSSSKSKLLITEYQTSLHELLIESPVKLYEITRERFEKVTLASTSSLVAVSFFNPNFSSLWSFLSSIQLISFLYLLNVPVSARTKGLLVGLRKYLIFPNLIQYLANDSGKDHNFSKLKDFKFKQNSFFVNSGTILSMFLFGISLFGLAKALEKIMRLVSKTRLRNFFISFYNNYRYSFFIRFWIQNYAEIAVSAGLSLLTNDLDDLNQAYSFFFSCIFSVKFKQFLTFLTIPLLFSLSLVYKEEIKSDTNTMSLYGSLFYEFKDDKGAIRSNFYTFYFCRRLFLILSVFLLFEYPMAQLILFEVFTLTVILTQTMLICAFQKPFNEPVLNYCNLITEALIGMTVLAYSLYLGEFSDEVIQVLDYVMIVFVNSIVAVQVSASFIIFAKVIRLKWMSRKNNKVQNEEEKNLKIVVSPDDDKILKLDYSGVPNVSYLSINEDAQDSFKRSKNSDEANSIY